MKKYIEKIIEIVLDNVSCEHQEREDILRGPTFDDPTYSLDNEQRVIKKCLAALPARLIEKPLVTKDWTEEKARKLLNDLTNYVPSSQYWTEAMRYATDFICSLLNELAAKINLKGD